MVRTPPGFGSGAQPSSTAGHETAAPASEAGNVPRVEAGWCGAFDANRTKTVPAKTRQRVTATTADQCRRAEAKPTNRPRIHLPRCFLSVGRSTGPLRARLGSGRQAPGVAE